jgi:predicted RNase H-like HicB family nuclease
MSALRFQVVIEQDEDGLYIAECPALQGCYSQGATFEEALTNVREVIEMCVREAEEDGILLDPRYPEVVGVKTIEIKSHRASA